MKSLPGEKFVDLCCVLCETWSPPKQQWLQETRESQYSSAWNGNHAVQELSFFFSRENFSQEFPPSLAHYRWKQRAQAKFKYPLWYSSSWGSKKWLKLFDPQGLRQVAFDEEYSPQNTGQRQRMEYIPWIHRLGRQHFMPGYLQWVVPDSLLLYAWP